MLRCPAWAVRCRAEQRSVGNEEELELLDSGEGEPLDHSTEDRWGGSGNRGMLWNSPRMFRCSMGEDIGATLDAFESAADEDGLSCDKDSGHCDYKFRSTRAKCKGLHRASIKILNELFMFKSLSPSTKMTNNLNDSSTMACAFLTTKFKSHNEMTTWQRKNECCERPMYIESIILRVKEGEENGDAKGERWGSPLKKLN